MGTSDKAIKILTVTVIASAAAYFGYRAYKKQYPFESFCAEKSSSASDKVATSAETSQIISNEKKPDETTPPMISVLDEEKRLELATTARSQGNDFYKVGDTHQAITFYTEAISLYPENHHDLALAYANRAACYLKLNHFVDVVDDCSNALKIQPEFVKALDRRAKAYEILGRLEDSLVDVTAACIIDDFTKGGMVERVENILRALSTQKAQKDFESKDLVLPSNSIIEEFLSTFPEEWDAKKIDLSSNTDLLNAIEAIRSKNYREAMNLSEKAIDSSNMLLPEALSLYGTFNFLKGDMKSASKYFEESLKLNPNNSNVLIKMALVELEQNHFPKMTEYLEKAQVADPNNPSLFYHRGEILALSGSLDGANVDFTTAISLCPDFILAYVHNARALLGLEKITEAETFLNKALHKFKDNVEIRNSLGEVLVMKREFSGAEKLFDNILKKHPNSPQIYLNKALLAMTHTNDIETAEKNLRRAIEIDPSFEAAHLQLANLLLSNGNVKDSMEHFDQAVKYANSLQELISVHSLKCASVAQLRITEQFPSLAAKMKILTQAQN